MKTRVLKSLTRRPLDDIYDDLTLVPLKFSSKKFEHRFKQHVSQTFGPRIALLALLEIILISMFWGAMKSAPSLTLAHYPNLREQEDGERALEEALSLLTGMRFFGLMLSHLLLNIVLALIPYLPVSRDHTEKSTYTVVFLQNLVGLTLGLSMNNQTYGILTPSSLALSLDSTTTSVAVDDDVEVVRESAVLCHEMVMWSFVTNILTLTIPLVSVDIFIQSRTKITAHLHGFYFVCVYGTYIISGAHIQGFTSLRTCAMYATLLCVLGLLALVGRYHREIQERIEFWFFLKNQLRLKVLHHEVQRLTPPKGVKEVQGESTMEELMSLLRYSQKLLGSTSNRLVIPEIFHAEEIIKEVLGVLSHGGNLFQVRFDNLPEEGESIIDQYIWGKSFVRSTSNATLEPNGPTTIPIEEYTPHKKSMRTKKEATHTKKQRDTNQPTNRSPAPMRLAGVPPSSVTTPSSYQISTPVAVTDLAFSEMTGNVGTNWQLDVFGFERKHENIFVQFGAYLLLPHSQFLDIPQERILQFLVAVEDCYWNNPYHNKIHAAEVAHATSCLVKMLNLSSGLAYQQVTELIYTVAALGHDVGHPSRNNQFFVNTFDPLAIIYNDVSVLENYHAFLTFQILDDDGCDIFQQLFVDTYRDVRKRIIEIILATDMKEHFEAISKFRVRRGASGFDVFNDPEDMWHMLKMIVKAADISHACVDWAQHLEWSCRIQEEFYQQGEEESQLGYTKSPLCDRDSHTSYPKSQKGFLEFVVAPLFLELREADTEGLIASACLNQLYSNKDVWARYEAEGTVVEIPQRIQAMRTVPPREGGPPGFLPSARDWNEMPLVNGMPRRGPSATQSPTRGPRSSLVSGKRGPRLEPSKTLFTQNTLTSPAHRQSSILYRTQADSDEGDEDGSRSGESLSSRSHRAIRVGPPSATSTPFDKARRNVRWQTNHGNGATKDNDSSHSSW